MARKPSTIKDDPPAASSSGEEEEEVEEEDAPNNGNYDGSESEDGGGEEEEGEEEEEEEEEEDEEDEDDEDDDNKEPKTEKIHHHTQPSQSEPVTKTLNSQLEEEEDEDDETESDSEPRSPGLSGFTIKKHVDSPNISVSQKPPKGTKETTVDKESLSPVLVSLKRPAEDNLPKDSKSTPKKLRNENGVGGDEGTATEKKLRLWDEPSEIAILKGMIEFQEDRGVDPTSDSIAFYEFMKDRFSFEVTKTQLMDKVRRLKNKYRTNVGRGQKGEDPVFSRPHDHKSFELSKRIWGGQAQNRRSSAKKKPANENLKPKTEVVKPKTEVAMDNGNAELAALQQEHSMVAYDIRKEGNAQEGSFSQLYPFLDLSLRNNSFFADFVSRDGANAMASCLRGLEKSTLEELEEEWRIQILDEAEVRMKRSTLLQKQVQLVSSMYARRG